MIIQSKASSVSEIYRRLVPSATILHPSLSPPPAAMGFAQLWAAPEVNPVNKKARTIPFLNPINVYGRVFFFAWFGFFIAFWSW